MIIIIIRIIIRPSIDAAAEARQLHDVRQASSRLYCVSTEQKDIDRQLGWDEL